MPRNKNWFDRLRDRLFPATDKEEGKATGRKRWVFKRLSHSHVVSTSSSKEESSQQTDILVKRQTHDDSNHTEGKNVSGNALHLSASAGISVNNKDASEAMLWSAVTSNFSNHPCEGKSSSGGENGSYAKIDVDHPAVAHHKWHTAATKIQSTFRGYLARKALRALKGLVKLQAIIRGRAVRRRAVATLKCLQSIVHIQSQVCATRYHLSQEKVRRKDSGLPRYEKIIKAEVNNRSRWDDILLTSEEEKSMLSSKTRNRREKIKADSPNRRHSIGLEGRKSMSGKLRNQLELSKSGTLLFRDEEIKRVDTVGGKQLRRLNKNTPQQQPPQCIHGLDSPTLTLPRRSLYHHNKRRASIIKAEDDEPELPKSPVLRTYMASTESAKAKARSSATLISSPRRLGRIIMGHQLGALSDGDSPYKCKISPMSSINSERTWTGTNLSGMHMDWAAAQHSVHRHRCAHSLQGMMDAAAATATVRPNCS